MECLWYLHRGMRCLIIVPTKDLVDQFYNDIKDYATNEDGELEPWYPVVQRIYSGKTKELEDNTDICISTWQSLSKIEDDKASEWPVSVVYGAPSRYSPLHNAPTGVLQVKLVPNRYNIVFNEFYNAIVIIVADYNICNFWI